MREMEACLTAELRDKITHRLEIKDIDDLHVGIVDRLEDDQIRLIKTSEMEGKDHFIKLDLVRSADDLAVYLNVSKNDLHY